jgi:predicted DCC family thiol-disulfide oxidoreductase YuxK
VNAMSEEPRLLVLYDADCGLCSRSASLLRRLDRAGRLRLLPLQAASEIAGAPPAAVLLDAMHVRDPEGRWDSAGAAWTRIAQEVPVLRPIAVVARIPGGRRFVEWSYARVAGNRHRISRLLGDDTCSVPKRNP